MMFQLDRSALKACLLALRESFQNTKGDTLVQQEAIRIRRQEIELWLSHLHELPTTLNRERLIAGIHNCEVFLADAMAALPNLEIGTVAEAEELVAKAKRLTFVSSDSSQPSLEVTKKMQEAVVASSVFRWALDSLEL